MPKLGLDITSWVSGATAGKDKISEVVSVAVKSGVRALGLRLTETSKKDISRQLSDMKAQSRLPLVIEIDPVLVPVSAALAFKPQTVSFATCGKSTQIGGSIALKQIESAPVVEAAQAVKKTDVSLAVAVEPQADVIRAARRIGADCIFLSTRELARAKGAKRKEEMIEDLNVAARLVKELKLDLYVGHGVDYVNIHELAQISEATFVFAGSSIMKRCEKVGLEEALKEFNDILTGRFNKVISKYIG
ncbi:MAG: pyridoxine 5'-phosphate synthase [Elusimicrobiota bacterium]